jgi:malonyl-CoA decarboxylase
MFESMQRRAAARAGDSAKVRRLVESCRALLSGRGEAGGVAQAKATLALWHELDGVEQRRFFQALLMQFSPEAEEVLAAARG